MTDAKFKREILKIYLKRRLHDLGRIPESQLRNHYHNYPPDQVTDALDELCEEGFCERFTTRRGASVIVLRDEEQLGRVLQEDVQARIQEAKG